ncbi:VOC family protein [Aquibacillus sp. 3ASR75-11]|uniref:VOC family protein n=1 Tax=Terrihalobacillus insolitus TaxID=2950438 RepID=A0A9X3WW73_9BACI|nr:VOC family protein [Terrihalobacillus insolitus]MDC3413258.1 VOC family protein [Terrihalobacillus insolitus]MDC3425688.1 VOC family protein [Terrihalobacillus insolitus]
MQTKLMHVRVNVKDLILAREWYTNNLGFKVSAIYPPDKPNYIHFEHSGGAIFAIMEDENYPSHGRFNFNVSDVDNLWNQLKDKVEVVEELFSTPYGTRKFTIRDIDGNELGFVQDN